MKKISKFVSLSSLVGLTLGFSPNLAIQSANAQTTKSCSAASLNSAYRKLGELPIVEVKTNGAAYSSTAYSGGNKRFAYIVLDSTKKTVARVDLSYSINQKGRNIASIKVCGDVQKSSEFPAVKFNFSGGKLINVSVIGTQNLTYVVPKPAHTTTILTVIDAT
ncbi:hypothetical protein [Brunnivagina elsteri]|uniref:Uncharacterized protein n=1 Tax=Brunnivagina elsteri CCALA 953 TaxID=987040 RepID=A0A2A2T9R8_9CYAN|nr:hypothetical protein [Calothrix elsteri]PAX45740.1 hypothetical protein CK510_30155 [Calothrix elsteri CCALA 953]